MFPPATYLGRLPKLPKVEAGGLERSYRRAPKHAGDKGKASKIEKDPAGICHLCQAGLKGFDWEDMWTAFVFIKFIPFDDFKLFMLFAVLCLGFEFQKVFFYSLSPGPWLRTAAEKMIKLSYVEPVEPPWVVEPSWTKFPLQNLDVNGKARFFRPDIWHTIQMGVGKDFASSALSLLVREVPGSNIDDRFGIISNEYIAWCKKFRKTKYVNKLDKRMIGGGRPQRRTIRDLEQSRPHCYDPWIFAILLWRKQRLAPYTWGHKVSVPPKGNIGNQWLYEQPLPSWSLGSSSRSKSDINSGDTGFSSQISSSQISRVFLKNLPWKNTY